jgi:hypothetical protein
MGYSHNATIPAMPDGATKIAIPRLVAATVNAPPGIVLDAPVESERLVEAEHGRVEEPEEGPLQAGPEAVLEQ